MEHGLSEGGGALSGQVDCTAKLSDSFCLAVHTLMAHVPNIWVLGIRVIAIIVQVWGKYMVIGYLDP